MSYFIAMCAIAFITFFLTRNWMMKEIASLQEVISKNEETMYDYRKTISSCRNQIFDLEHQLGVAKGERVDLTEEK